MQYANVKWQTNDDGKIQPYSIDFDDIYYSTKNGQHESEYVFLAHNHLHQRFTQTEKNMIVAETGFGSGLNFLVVANCWRQVAPDDVSLQYLAFEQFPLNFSDMQIACDCWPQYSAVTAPLLAAYAKLQPGKNSILLPNNITLILYINDIATTLPLLQAEYLSSVNAWLLDGYSPSKNSIMWQFDTLSQIAKLSANGCSFATFTSAGEVRRNLQKVGFKVFKHKGFGKKREMLAGFIGE